MKGRIRNEAHFKHPSFKMSKCPNKIWELMIIVELFRVFYIFVYES